MIKCNNSFVMLDFFFDPFYFGSKQFYCDSKSHWSPLCPFSGLESPEIRDNKKKSLLDTMRMMCLK